MTFRWTEICFLHLPSFEGTVLSAENTVA